MPEWEDQAAVACAVQNLHLMATAVGVAGCVDFGGGLAILQSRFLVPAAF